MYLLDTNTCIYIIKKKPGSVLKKLKEASGREIFVSAITVAELEYGIAGSRYPEKNRIALIEFLSFFERLSFDDTDAVEYGLIRNHLEKEGRVIGPLDLLLAAQALSRKLVLVTNNLKEFKRVRGLMLENWV